MHSEVYCAPLKPASQKSMVCLQEQLQLQHSMSCVSHIAWTLQAGQPISQSLCTRIFEEHSFLNQGVKYNGREVANVRECVLHHGHE